MKTCEHVFAALGSAVPLRPLFQHVQSSVPTFLPPCLNPSSATLFTIRFRTTVATPLQKAAPLVRSNRLKPFCNLGLNGVSTLGSNRVAPQFQTPLQTKKNTEMLLSVFANLDWNRGSHKVERSVQSYIRAIPTQWFQGACGSRRTTASLRLLLRTCAKDLRAFLGRFRRSLRSWLRWSSPGASRCRAC